MVPVLDKDKKPLMPCSEKRARKLMEKGEAKPYWSRGVFCIILQRKPSGRKKQKITLGLDIGSKMSAISVLTKNSTIINIQYEAVTDVKKKVESRKNARRARRFRNTPYRANRSNRAILKKNRLPHSTKARWNQHLNKIIWLKKIIPISNVHVEDIKARTKKGKNYDGESQSWNLNFSPLQQGKNWFYSKLKELKLKIKLFIGTQTSELRNLYNFHKNKEKLSVDFHTHCVDSWVLANFSNSKLSTKLLFCTPLRFARRQIHRFNFSKGGIRKLYGGTRSLGLTRGSLIRHPKYGLSLIGGTSKSKISLHSILDFKRLTQSAKPSDCKILTNFRWTVQWV